MRTVGELGAVLAEIDAHPGANFLVHVEIPRTDIPSAVKLTEPGEDETENPEWPPALLF